MARGRFTVLASQLLDPSAGQLVEHLLVELLVCLLAPHREKDVATDELVHDLAVGGEAVEDDVFVVVKLDHHVLGLPIHIPSLKIMKQRPGE